ncbi:MAG: cytochrome c oxidase subunit II [Acidimicrobiia bacterium]
MTFAKKNSSRKPNSWLGLGLLGLVAVFLSGCATGTPLDTLQPEGRESKVIHSLVGPVFIVAGVVMVFVLGAAIYMAWRFRERSSDDPDVLPEQIHGNNKLEIGWTVVPTVVLAVIAVFTLVQIFDLEKRDDDALHVLVEGNQWWWQFSYDLDGDGEYDIVTANEMVIEAGRQADLSITSNDVIHSFWIPRLNGKRDAVPGRMHTLSLESEKPGYFFGQCTEFCGLSHAEMRMRVIVLPPDEFEQWIQDQLADARPAETEAQQRGQEVFEANCASCHRIRGLETQPSDEKIPLVSNTAPDLTHFASRRVYAGGIFELYDDDGNVDRGQLSAWIRDPKSQKAMAPDEQRGMPTLGLDEDQISDVVEYLISTADGPVWTGPRND